MIGEKSFSEWHGLIQGTFKENIDSLTLMCLDTCADLHDVSVASFYGRLRVKFKRSNQGIGDSHWRTISGKSIETITAGRRPNFVRIYDKTAERNQEYRKRIKRNPTLPTFEKLYGHAPEAVISRVERQHSARGVPPQLRTFGDLHRAADYNPFSTMEINESIDPLDFASMPGKTATEIAQMGFYSLMCNKWGAQTAARWYNQCSGGNLSRFKKQHPCLFESASGTTLLEQIVTEYRNSTIRQLNA